MERDFQLINQRKTTSTGPSASELALESQIRSLEDAKLAAERALQDERSGREVEVSELTMQNAELVAKLQKSLADRDNEVQGERAQREEAQKQIAKFNATNEAQKEELLETAAQIDGLSAQLTKIRNEHALAETNVQKLGIRLAKTEEQARVAEQSRTAVEGQLAGRNSEYLTLQQQVSALEALLATTRSELIESQESCGKLSTELLETRADLDQQKKRQEFLSNEYETLQSTLQSKEGALATFTKRVTNLEELLQQSSDEHNRLREDLRRTKQAHAEYQAEADLDKSGLEDQLEKLRLLEEETRATLQTTQVEMERLVSASARLKQELGEVNQTSLESLSQKQATLDTTRTEYRSSMIRVFSAMKQAMDRHEAISQNLTSHPKSSSTETQPIGAASTTLVSIDDTDLDQYVRISIDYETRLHRSSLQLDEAVTNRLTELSQLLRKWQKECKGYRERAKQSALAAAEKIAFRNFSKGDLALFLPTRNSTAQVWAAFNAGFPHYFLKPTGVIAEQIKTRECKFRILGSSIAG